mmetsp:Transcript_36358/g.68444  ORF Transcript_36358/g.68444 Transcript_36358/m.68444 type:complete len:337 (-) Transcript_36358:30-1040(-)
MRGIKALLGYRPDTVDTKTAARIELHQLSNSRFGHDASTSAAPSRPDVMKLPPVGMVVVGGSAAQPIEGTVWEHRHNRKAQQRLKKVQETAENVVVRIHNKTDLLEVVHLPGNRKRNSDAKPGNDSDAFLSKLNLKAQNPELVAKHLALVGQVHQNLSYANRVSIGKLSSMSASAQATLATKRPSAVILDYLHRPCTAQATALNAHIRASQLIGTANMPPGARTMKDKISPELALFRASTLARPNTSYLPPVATSQRKPYATKRYINFHKRSPYQNVQQPVEDANEKLSELYKRDDAVDADDMPDGDDRNFQTPCFHSNDGFGNGILDKETGTLYL